MALIYMNCSGTYIVHSPKGTRSCFALQLTAWDPLVAELQVSYTRSQYYAYFTYIIVYPISVKLVWNLNISKFKEYIDR